VSLIPFLHTFVRSLSQHLYPRAMKKKKTLFVDPKLANKRSDTQANNKLSEKVTKPIDEEIEAYETLTKETLKREALNKQKIENVKERADRELATVKAVFPFDLFPDEVVVDENKITIVNHSFFFNKHIRSILVKDIANVTATTSLFFGSLQIVDQYFTQDPVRVEYLKRTEAICARRLIQGLMIAYQDKIDFSKMDTNVVYKQLLEIGKVAEENRP
jgi:hypothetical protein